MSRVTLREQRAALEWLISQTERPLLSLGEKGHVEGAPEQLRRAKAALATLDFMIQNEAAIRRAASG